jgi:hypothetical protein
MIQENNMIITAALLVLAVALGILTMRRRRQHGAPQLTGSTGIFCTKCGTENPASNEFCRSCDNRLRSLGG